MLSKEIKNIVQSLWDRLWAGGIANPISSIEQISYLLFMKRLENFKSNIDLQYKWSYYSIKYDGDELLNHMKNVVFEYIKNDLAKTGEPFAMAMEDASLSVSPSSLLKESMRYIDSIYREIEKQENENKQYFQDIQGDVYEYLLKQTNQAGKNGQFRTPRHIIQMMVEILIPNLDGKICDLASGSGGFLVGAYQFLLTKHSHKTEKDENGFQKGIDGSKLKGTDRKKLNEEIFYGFDVDSTMVRIGMMNLMMHGIEKPHIRHVNTLTSGYEESIKDRTLKSKKDKLDQYKYILANPPFTGKVNSLEISKNLTRIYPPQFDNKGIQKEQNVQSELLFLERIISALIKGGKAAVIVPEGVLFGTSKAQKKAREILLKDNQLEAVISLPNGVFKPYTAVKTSILIFTKVKQDSDNWTTDKVWFCELKSDGYSLDDNRRRLKDFPLPEVKVAFEKREIENTEGRKSHFYVPITEIQENGLDLSYNRYREYEYVQQEYAPPKEILSKLLVLEREILKNMDELNNLIG